jgi:hypothetical protein
MANGTATRDGDGYYHNIPGHPGLKLISVTHILQVLDKPGVDRWNVTEERKLALAVAADLYEASHGTPKMSRMAYLETLNRLIGKERAGEKAKRKAGDIGKRVHALIEYDMMKQLGKAPPKAPKVEPDLAVALANFEEFKAEHRFKPKLAEERVYSLAYGFAGTLDSEGEFDDMDNIMDWKTGKDIYPESYLQAAAYRMALIEMGHLGSDSGAVIVLLPKAAGEQFKVKRLSPAECDAEFETFLAVKESWTWWNRHQEASKAAWEAMKAADKHQGTVAIPDGEQGPTAQQEAEAAVQDDIRRELTSDPIPCKDGTVIQP